MIAEEKATAPEMELLKNKLKATWTAGDFGKIAEAFTDGAAEFVQHLDIQPGMKVLDVACGSGNQSIPAARLGARVSGIDIVADLVRQAQERAQSEGLEISFEEGDAENLPYGEESFDLVMTMFGAIFAPRPERVAEELVRVCRPGGMIAMGNWTADGFIGQVFRIIGKYVPPPPMPSPLLWGDEGVVKERLGEKVSELGFERRLMAFDFPFGVKETVQYWRDYYGPMHKAFAALEEKGQAGLQSDLEELWAKHNLAEDGTTYIEKEYVLITAKRR